MFLLAILNQIWCRLPWCKGFFFVDKPITRRETYPKLFTIMMLIQKENSPTKKSASRSLFAAACILFSIFSVDDLMNLIWTFAVQLYMVQIGWRCSKSIPFEYPNVLTNTWFRVFPNCIHYVYYVINHIDFILAVLAITKVQSWTQFAFKRAALLFDLLIFAPNQSWPKKNKIKPKKHNLRLYHRIIINAHSSTTQVAFSMSSAVVVNNAITDNRTAAGNNLFRRLLTICIDRQWKRNNIQSINSAIKRLIAKQIAFFVNSLNAICNHHYDCKFQFMLVILGVNWSTIDFQKTSVKPIRVYDVCVCRIQNITNSQSILNIILIC